MPVNAVGRLYSSSQAQPFGTLAGRFSSAVPANNAKAAQLVGDLYGSENMQELVEKRKTA